MTPIPQKSSYLYFMIYLLNYLTSSMSSFRNCRAMHGSSRASSRLAVATSTSDAHEKQHKLTKLLVNVNIRDSLGPVNLVMSPENTVGELIRTAIEIYVKEKRRPLLSSTDPLCYELHYSQFSMESKFQLHIILVYRTIFFFTLSFKICGFLNIYVVK